MLVIETLNDADWRKVGQLVQGEQPGSISDNQGTRQIYVFECLGDHSVIYRLPKGVDFEAGNKRHHFNTRETWLVVQKLQSGDSMELDVTTDRSLRHRVRFRHV